MGLKELNRLEVGNYPPYLKSIGYLTKLQIGHTFRKIYAHNLLGILLNNIEV